MIWFSKINSQAFKDWFIGTGSGTSIKQGRKLDTFVSSMRKFNNSHSWMVKLYNNQPIGGTDDAQNKTDLGSAGLFDSATDSLSILGRRTIEDWMRYNIPASADTYEIHRCFLLIKNAIQLGNITYKDIFNFWKELRINFSFNRLISSPELLYFFSFFSKDFQGFNPYKAIKGLNMTDADFPAPIDWNLIKTFYGNADLNTVVDKYERTIDGYVSRQGRVNFCIALELLLNPQDATSIINGLTITAPLKESLSLIVRENSNISDMELNKIYFGAPGTGKSQRIKQYTTDTNSIRVTFHPDTDYSSFVGSYKTTEGATQGQITYKFVPQQLLQAYINAWTSDENIYLVIEEINRGNCAQIFGDIFQLIERNAEGYSTYPIDTDTDLSKFLKLYFESLVTNGGADALKAQRYIDYFGGSYKKMSLPNNLYIHATMNTSDQSLFPIDSAFKRRWDWEYVPIEFDDTEADGYLITIGIETFSWRSFIEAVNKKIEIVSESEDKKLGQFFIKSFDNNISEKTFKTKVMFYLWNDILKDEPKIDERFFFRGKENANDESQTPFSFSDLFSGNSSVLLKNFMTYLSIEAEQ
jgi:hypothetical protein